MASRNLLRRTCTILLRQPSSRNIGLPTLTRYQQFTCKNLPLKHHSQKFSSSRPLSASSFECVNIQDAEDFNTKVLKSKTPVVVDFHATWCGPCKVLGPRLEAIISDKKGKVVMAKVDIDENPGLAMDYEVRSVPMVVSVKDGKVKNSFIGLKDDDIIQSFVNELI
ncbi:hypothetical protein SNE40_018953 [Patella caerulea]|uniref:Thioredoxin domain-containing protein n=1 Tax=Patella caerulea TaxID=87958 RepID=A0AAN8PHG3_PATCE